MRNLVSKIFFGASLLALLFFSSNGFAQRLFTRVNLHQSLGGNFEDIDPSLSTSVEG